MVDLLKMSERDNNPQKYAEKQAQEQIKKDAETLRISQLVPNYARTWGVGASTSNKVKLLSPLEMAEFMSLPVTSIAQSPVCVLKRKGNDYIVKFSSDSDFAVTEMTDYDVGQFVVKNGLEWLL